MDDIQAAARLAEHAHRGQLDKGGQPYMSHIYRVAAGSPSDCQVPALLHDVVEDTDTTLDDLRDFGFSEEDVSAVDALTRRKDEVYAVYIERVKDNHRARWVKIADLLDNLSPARRELAERAGHDVDRLWARYVAALGEIMRRVDGFTYER